MYNQGNVNVFRHYLIPVRDLNFIKAFDTEQGYCLLGFLQVAGSWRVQSLRIFYRFVHYISEKKADTMVVLVQMRRNEESIPIFEPGKCHLPAPTLRKILTQLIKQTDQETEPWLSPSLGDFLRTIPLRFPELDPLICWHEFLIGNIMNYNAVFHDRQGYIAIKVFQKGNWWEIRELELCYYEPSTENPEKKNRVVIFRMSQEHDADVLLDEDDDGQVPIALVRDAIFDLWLQNQAHSWSPSLIDYYFPFPPELQIKDENDYWGGSL